jgi:hypothetical protein
MAVIKLLVLRSPHRCYKYQQVWGFTEDSLHENNCKCFSLHIKASEEELFLIETHLAEDTPGT